jgi:hypothetical protein
MQVALSAAPPVPSTDPTHKDICDFCNDKTHTGYKTKHGALKDEGVLEKNLAADGTISSDPDGSPLYPLDGGGDKTKGWSVRAGVFEDVPTAIKAAAHHIIPGDAAMAKVPALEQWTTQSKGGVIKEDIGYSIDCAANGIFLPRYPDLFGTKHMPGLKGSDGKGVEQREYYGRSWSELAPREQEDIGYTIMAETSLQIHHTSHGAGYLRNPTMSYDKEARAACQALADRMAKQRPMCDQQPAKPYDPPYGLVARINGESRKLRQNITGNPKYWCSWVTRLADKFTQDLVAGRARLIHKFGISKET